MILSPGPIQLTTNGGAFQIVGPGILIGDWVTGLAGVLSASFQAQLLNGNGGTNGNVYLQTSLDQGQTPIDIAAFQFGAASATEIVNLSALTPKPTPLAPTNQSLAPGSTIDGVLGDRLRAVVVVTGTYGLSTLLNVTGVVR
jgi:hypothetical protein